MSDIYKEAIVFLQANYLYLLKLGQESGFIKRKRKLPAEYITDDFDNLNNAEKRKIVSKAKTLTLKLFNSYIKHQVAERTKDLKCCTVEIDLRYREIKYFPNLSISFQNLMNFTNLEDYICNRFDIGLSRVGNFLRITNLRERFNETHNNRGLIYAGSRELYNVIPVSISCGNNYRANSFFNRRYSDLGLINFSQYAYSILENLDHSINFISRLAQFCEEIEEKIELHRDLLTNAVEPENECNIVEESHEEISTRINVISGEQRQSVLDRLRGRA